MNNREYFEMLLNNFRLSEAMGYIAAMVNMKQISAERGEECKQLIGWYKNIICNSLWDEKGIMLLESDIIDANCSKDVINEKNRVISLISDWTENDKRMILQYVSAYYALVNEQHVYFKMYMDRIEQQIRENIPNNNQVIGGYEAFQKMGNILEQYCCLEDNIFNVIKELSIKIQLFAEN